MILRDDLRDDLSEFRMSSIKILHEVAWRNCIAAVIHKLYYFWYNFTSITFTTYKNHINRRTYKDGLFVLCTMEILYTCCYL